MRERAIPKPVNVALIKLEREHLAAQQVLDEVEDLVADLVDDSRDAAYLRAVYVTLPDCYARSRAYSRLMDMGEKLRPLPRDNKALGKDKAAVERASKVMRDADRKMAKAEDEQRKIAERYWDDPEAAKEMLHHVVPGSLRVEVKTHL